MKIVSAFKKNGAEFYKWITASQYVAVYPDIKALDKHVNQFQYHPTKWYDCYNKADFNLGDSLSFVVVDWMLSQRGLDVNQEVRKKYFLNTIGSNVFSSYQNAVVWGSGCGTGGELRSRLNRLLSSYPFRKLDVRAVRGPKTRERLLQYGHKCPPIYGDPAILMPLIYNPSVEPHKSHDVLVIPQFVHENEIREKYPNYYMESMNTNDYKRVINAIVSSKKVLTSSLHGIILAEAYGVPAVFFQTLKKTFKFEDYYASTGRNDIHLSSSFEEALMQEPPQLPDLSELQKGLIESFPYDLWES